MRPHGALVVSSSGGDHRARLRAVAELHRIGGESGRVVQAAAAVGQVGQELGALLEGGGPTNGADVFP